MRTLLHIKINGIAVQLQADEPTSPILTIDDIELQIEGEAAATELTDYFGGVLKLLSN